MQRIGKRVNETTRYIKPRIHYARLIQNNGYRGQRALRTQTSALECLASGFGEA